MFRKTAVIDDTKAKLLTWKKDIAESRGNGYIKPFAKVMRDSVLQILTYPSFFLFSNKVQVPYR